MAKKRPYQVAYVKNKKWRIVSFGSQANALKFMKKLKKKRKTFRSWINR